MMNIHNFFVGKTCSLRNIPISPPIIRETMTATISGQAIKPITARYRRRKGISAIDSR